MNFSSIIGGRISIAVLATGFLFLFAACGADPSSTTAPATTSTDAPAPAPTTAPTPTPTVAPTPTPTPEPTLNDLLLSAGEKLAAISTVKFALVDETESGAPFFGTTFKSLEGEVKSPESFRMQVKVVAPGFGFVEIEMLAVGDQSFMKFSADAPWAPLPLEQVPFNFTGIGVTLSELLSAMTGAAITGRESVRGVQTIRIEGNIASDGMSNLITSTDPGHAIALTFWFDQDEHTLRQLLIAGKLFDGDAPETRRRLDITGINVPVDIQLPDPSSR